MAQFAAPGIRIAMGTRSTLTPTAAVSRELAEPITVPKAICGKRSRVAMSPG
jgi:hypothetical protein